MDNNFGSYFTRESLLSIFERFIHTNTAIGLDNITYSNFKDNIENEITIIQRKLNNGTYNFTPYKEKLLLKNRDSKPRVISIPTIRDKIVLKTIDLYLKNQFNELTQPLPQTCIREIKSNMEGYDSFIKLDVSNFYDSISHGMLYSTLANSDEEISQQALDLIKKAMKTPTKLNGETLVKDVKFKGIPQGVSISNILSTIFLKKLDEKFQKKENIFYTRYVDDVIVLCEEGFKNDILQELEYEFMGMYNLELNKMKTEISSLNTGFDFLGYKIFRSDERYIFTVKQENKYRFEESLIKIFTQKKYSKRMSTNQFLFLLNNKITGSISNEVNGDMTRKYNYGWLFYYSQINDTSYLYHLDWLINKLLDSHNLLGINRDYVKSFVNTFYEIKYNYEESNYIFRPDNLNLLERKELLIDTFNVPENRLNNNNTITKLYYQLVYRPILEYEKDIKKWTY